MQLHFFCCSYFPYHAYLLRSLIHLLFVHFSLTARLSFRYGSCSHLMRLIPPFASCKHMSLQSIFIQSHCQTSFFHLPGPAPIISEFPSTCQYICRLAQANPAVKHRLMTKKVKVCNRIPTAITIWIQISCNFFALLVFWITSVLAKRFDYTFISFDTKKNN